MNRPFTFMLVALSLDGKISPKRRPWAAQPHRSRLDRSRNHEAAQREAGGSGQHHGGAKLHPAGRLSPHPSGRSGKESHPHRAGRPGRDAAHGEGAERRSSHHFGGHGGCAGRSGVCLQAAGGPHCQGRTGQVRQPSLPSWVSSTSTSESGAFWSREAAPSTDP